MADDEKNGSVFTQEAQVTVSGPVMSEDERHLATLGYKQVFIRSFGLFENWYNYLSPHSGLCH